MPMPRLPATHQRKTAIKTGFHAKKNNAATAPMWKATMKKVVTQFTGCVNVLSPFPFLAMARSPLSAVNCLWRIHPFPPESNVTRSGGGLCNTCVILDFEAKETHLEVSDFPPGGFEPCENLKIPDFQTLRCRC